VPARTLGGFLGGFRDDSQENNLRCDNVQLFRLAARRTVLSAPVSEKRVALNRWPGRLSYGRWKRPVSMTIVE
jgi:hypothetical protein